MYGCAGMSVFSVSGSAEVVAAESVRLRSLPRSGGCGGCGAGAETVLKLCGHEWCRRCLQVRLAGELSRRMKVGGGGGGGGEAVYGRCPKVEGGWGCGVVMSEMEMRWLVGDASMVSSVVSPASSLAVSSALFTAEPMSAATSAESLFWSSSEGVGVEVSEYLEPTLRCEVETALPEVPELVMPEPSPSVYADSALQLGRSDSIPAFPLAPADSEYADVFLRCYV